mmetsp:Transcript_18545/g.42536  ORF Transcript_18545/g.42536 Transcript_18545/m.42536 type:complete len:279 (+) Transcript_18545:568-1404(+)
MLPSQVRKSKKASRRSPGNFLSAMKKLHTVLKESATSRIKSFASCSPLFISRKELVALVEHARAETAGQRASTAKRGSIRYCTSLALVSASQVAMFQFACIALSRRGRIGRLTPSLNGLIKLRAVSSLRFTLASAIFTFIRAAPTLGRRVRGVSTVIVVPRSAMALFSLSSTKMARVIPSCIMPPHSCAIAWSSVKLARWASKRTSSVLSARQSGELAAVFHELSSYGRSRSLVLSERVREAGRFHLDSSNPSGSGSPMRRSRACAFLAVSLPLVTRR